MWVLTRKGAAGSSSISSRSPFLGTSGGPHRAAPSTSSVVYTCPCGQVLVPELRGEEGVEAPPASAVAGEHEVGHRVVGEGPHQHGGQRGYVGGHRRAHRRTGRPIHR